MMTDKEKFNLLKTICQKQFKKIGGNDIQKKRIVRELNFFRKNPSLIIDTITLLKSKKRGGDKNAPNSYLLFLLGITNKEPDYDKEFTFVFEVDEENKRMSPPDIDIDFEHRDAILEHICDLYGMDKVALIGTAISYKPKASIQFSAKALDVTGTAKEGDKGFSSENDQEGKRLSKILPNLPGVSLDDFLGEKNKKGEVYKPPNNRVREAVEAIQEESKRYPEVFVLAKKLEGMFKAFGTHAAGVVISSRSIDYDVPLHIQEILGEWGEKKDKSSLDLMTTQFDMDDIEDIGLLKFDFLQIDTLRQIRLCQNLIMESRGWDELPFDLDNLETNDPNVLKTVNTCKLEGLFQISGDAFAGKDIPKKNYETGEYVKNAKGKVIYRHQSGVMEIIGCSDFSDIVAANALGRPGPLICDMHRKYGENKKDPDNIDFAHPLLEPILKETYGQLIYQEQLIEMSQKLARFTYKLADKLRKACAKKKKELLDDIRPLFFKGCKENNIPDKLVGEMWQIAVEFGAYAFNKAHSTAYAEITYQTAYLKTYYPEEFICAILNSMAHKNDEALQISIGKFQKEYKKLDILPPDINKSKETYVPTGKKMQIQTPLVALKSIGDKVSEHIVGLQPLVKMEHFLEAMDKTVVTSKVIQIFKDEGVFDSIGDRQSIEKDIKKHAQLSSLVKNKKKDSCNMGSDDLFD